MRTWWGKGKGKVHPTTGHESPNGSRDISLLFLEPRRYMGEGGQWQAPAALPPGKRAVTRCIGGWVGPRTGLDGCGKSRSHRDSIHGQYN